MNRAILSLAALLLMPPVLRSQNATVLLNQGVRAYQDLNLDEAVQLLRRSLAPAAPVPLTDRDTRRALSFLGAAEYFGGRHDTAAAVFQRLVALAPRFRLDPVAFPPELIAVFESVRRNTPAVAAVAEESDITLDGDAFPIRLYASTPHSIQVRVLREDGSLIRELYDGPIADSVVVRWPVLDTNGTAPALGRLVCVVLSRDTQGRPARRLRLPLTVTVQPDGAPPRDSDAPDPAPSRHVSGLLTGIVAAAAAAALPTLVAAGPGDAGAGRYIVAGTVSLVGVAALLVHPHPATPVVRPPPDTSPPDAPGGRDLRLHVTPGTARSAEL